VAEQTLIQVYAADELRRRRWLDGHLRINRASLLMPDSVPDITSARSTPHVPDWVNTCVFDRGARFFHNTTGPLALWFGVVESDQEQRHLMFALEEGIRMGITHDGADVLLQIAVEPSGSLDPALAPYRFCPDEPSSAIELLLAALTSVRLDWYRLHDDWTLEHLRGKSLDIPADALTPILERVDAILARAELEAPESLVPRAHVWFARPAWRSSASSLLTTTLGPGAARCDYPVTTGQSNGWRQAPVCTPRAKIVLPARLRITALTTHYVRPLTICNQLLPQTGEDRASLCCGVDPALRYEIQNLCSQPHLPSLAA
jgi:hypothetical protein